MRYYVISDVHGFYTEMIKALKKNGFFDDKEPHKLIVCGDMMDRGAEALKMQKFMLDLLGKDELIFIRGNHEDLFCELLEAIEKAPNSNGFYLRNNHHWSNGTIFTVVQLCGLKDEFEGFDDMQAFVEKIKATPFYSRLIPASVNYYETDNYVFVHGWIPIKTGYDKNDKKIYRKHRSWRNATPKQWDDARWENGIIAASKGMILDDKTIVCGHFRTSYGHKLMSNGRKTRKLNHSVYRNKGIIALDGTTAVSGVVNCIVIED